MITPSLSPPAGTPPACRYLYDNSFSGTIPQELPAPSKGCSISTTSSYQCPLPDPSTSCTSGLSCKWPLPPPSRPSPPPTPSPPSPPSPPPVCDDFQLSHASSSCEGADQTNYLGVFSAVCECAIAATLAQCTMYMFSAANPAWGCRCCLAKTGDHASWNIYSSLPPPPSPPSPPTSPLSDNLTVENISVIVILGLSFLWAGPITWFFKRRLYPPLGWERVRGRVRGPCERGYGSTDESTTRDHAGIVLQGGPGGINGRGGADRQGGSVAMPTAIAMPGAATGSVAMPTVIATPGAAAAMPVAMGIVIS